MKGTGWSYFNGSEDLYFKTSTGGDHNPFIFATNNAIKLLLMMMMLYVLTQPASGINTNTPNYSGSKFGNKIPKTTAQRPGTVTDNFNKI